MRETREVVESFTTEPHGYVTRGNKTVRARAIEFIETLQIRQVKEMPLGEAKDLFQLVVDVWDEKSLNRYFGTQAHRSTKKISCRKQYASGTVSQRTIELAQDVKERKGYLEKLGLVHYETRGKTVFLVLESAPLVPELMKPCVSNDNLSLPLKGKGAYWKNLSHKGKDGIVGERSEREYIGGEINRSSESDLQSTLGVATAKPVDSEPYKAEVKWKGDSIG